jgi:hypothetical protein
MIYSFKTKDHPEANGRTPSGGEMAWTLQFLTDDGATILVRIGQVGRDAIRAMLLQEDADDIPGAMDALKNLAIAADTAELMLREQFPDESQSLRSKITVAKTVIDLAKEITVK